MFHRKRPFLHNIYYHCISHRKEKTLKAFKNSYFVITPYFNDARETIKSLKSPYDIIFLDAFTPVKLPTLWTKEFFAELYRLSKPDSMLVTYSSSAAVRNAMISAGFFIGKILDKKNKSCGTCASKNKNYIENPLDDFELGLLKTNAGILFRDEQLNSSPENILNTRENEKMKLGLESSSSYMKRNKGLYNDKIQ